MAYGTAPVTASGRASGVRGLPRIEKRLEPCADRQRIQKAHARARGVTMCACGCVDGRNVPYVHMHMEHQSKHACGRAR